VLPEFPSIGCPVEVFVEAIGLVVDEIPHCLGGHIVGGAAFAVETPNAQIKIAQDAVHVTEYMEFVVVVIVVVVAVAVVVLSDVILIGGIMFVSVVSFAVLVGRMTV